MPTILTAFRDADDEERRRLLPDRSSAPSSRGNRRNTHRPSSSSALLGALASASIVALVGVRARGGSMTTNESSASLGVGRSRSQMLSGLAAAPCLDKCAGAERDGVRRLQSGNGTCADADAIEAYGCFARCGCFESSYFREMRAVSCPNVNEAEAAHAAAFDDAWTTRVNARLQADCPAEYAKTNTRTDEEIAGHEVVGNEAPNATAAKLGARMFPNGYSDFERDQMANPTTVPALGRRNFWRAHKINGKHTYLAPVPTKSERSPGRAPITFRLYTQCKTQEVKVDGGEFWFKALMGAYIERHNYGSDKFFGKKTRLRMNRTELSDGVYGYELTTQDVDFEYGFALENSVGAVYKDIGKDSTLRRETCVQRYGAYFNRMVTLNRGKSIISAVFGDCDSVCPEDYVDEAYCRQPFTNEPGQSASAAVNLGQVDDARLINLASVMLFSSDTSVMDPSSRAETFRQDAGSKAEQKWIVAAIDYAREFVKMVQLTIQRDPVTGHAKVWISGKRRYTFVTNGGYAYAQVNTQWSNRIGCSGEYCNAARYDIPNFWNLGVQTSAFTASLTRLEYTKLSLGDAPPTGHNVVFEPSFLTTSREILASGAWGEDMDVRRVIIKNGVLCGASINYANCMFGKAFALKSTVPGYSGPTKTRKDWVFVVVEHVWFKMIRVAITLNGDSVHAEVIGAGYVSHVRDPADLTTSDSMAYDASAKWIASASNQLVAADFSANGYGLGGFKFDLAPEMFISLRDVDCD